MSHRTWRKLVHARALTWLATGVTGGSFDPLKAGNKFVFAEPKIELATPLTQKLAPVKGL